MMMNAYEALFSIYKMYRYMVMSLKMGLMCLECFSLIYLSKGNSKVRQFSHVFRVDVTQLAPYVVSSQPRIPSKILLPDNLIAYFDNISCTLFNGRHRPNDKFFDNHQCWFDLRFLRPLQKPSSFDRSTRTVT